MGVDRNDIVLGLQPEYARPDTGYNVAYSTPSIMSQGEKLDMIHKFF